MYGLGVGPLNDSEPSKPRKSWVLEPKGHGNSRQGLLSRTVNTGAAVSYGSNRL